MLSVRHRHRGEFPTHAADADVIHIVAAVASFLATFGGPVAAMGRSAAIKSLFTAVLFAFIFLRATKVKVFKYSVGELRLNGVCT